MIRCFMALIMIAGFLHAGEFYNAPDNTTAPFVRETALFVTSITITNPYDRAVKIVRLDSTCTCAHLDLDEKFLLPGASSVLHLSSENHNRSGSQHVNVSLYVSDPELEPIEAVARWNVLAAIQVDAIGPNMDPKVRPDQTAWHDIYRYVAKTRPDELHRLRKRIRLSCPSGEAPAGGLKLTAIDYPGTLWSFVQSQQPDGSILVTAKAKDPQTEAVEGTYDERVVLHTNHPDKAIIELTFLALVDKQAGQKDPDSLIPLP